MILGLPILVFVHVVISLIAIVAGLPVVRAFLGNRISSWTPAFLLFTVLTTLTGFVLFDGLTPAFFTGLISTAVLAAALYAFYGKGLVGPWRWIYVVSAMAAFYLNCFVLVVQSFLKIAPLHALAPTGGEPPFAAAQGVVLVAFIVFGWLSVKRFRGPAL
ncbi:hypothetical protein sos41_42770 [Alphaproteobacteria bacterium SO-S41]|nr:hypothetical protein sos41_42770 [Alphaproteobacteria bacterium SO-S41]